MGLKGRIDGAQNCERRGQSNRPFFRRYETRVASPDADHHQVEACRGGLYRSVARQRALAGFSGCPPDISDSRQGCPYICTCIPAGRAFGFAPFGKLRASPSASLPSTPLPSTSLPSTPLRASPSTPLPSTPLRARRASRAGPSTWLTVKMLRHKTWRTGPPTGDIIAGTYAGHPGRYDLRCSVALPWATGFMDRSLV